MPNEPLYQFYETLPGGDITGGVGDVGEGDVRHLDVSGATTADLSQTSHSGSSSTPCQTRLSSG